MYPISVYAVTPIDCPFFCTTNKNTVSARSKIQKNFGKKYNFSWTPCCKLFIIPEKLEYLFKYWNIEGIPGVFFHMLINTFLLFCIWHFFRSTFLSLADSLSNPHCHQNVTSPRWSYSFLRIYRSLELWSTNLDNRICRWWCLISRRCSPPRRRRGRKD